MTSTLLEIASLFGLEGEEIFDNEQVGLKILD